MSSCVVIVLLFLSLAIVGQAKPLVVEECGPGEYRYVDPQLTVCRDCPQYTYSSTRDQADHCASCSQHCFDKRNAVVLHSCNSTHDLSCRCIDGYYASSERTICKRHTTCPENCLKHPGSASTNTKCYEPCPTTTSVNELSVQSSTGSTAVVTNDQSTASPPNLSSSLLNVTTSSSNQTASDYYYFLLLLLLLVPLACVLFHYREKIRLNLKRFFLPGRAAHPPQNPPPFSTGLGTGFGGVQRTCRRHIYQMIPANGGGQHPAVNRPPQPPHRSAALGPGNDRNGIRQPLNGSDLRPATPSLEHEVPSDGDGEVSFQVLPPHDDPVLPEVLPNEALFPVPNNQTLPLPESETAGETSSEQRAALLPESRPDGSSSRPLSHHEDLLPEDDYAQARLLSGTTDIQDSLIEHNSVDPSANTSNSDDLGASTSNTEDIRGSRTMPGVQDNHRASARPCARVPPLVIPQPNLYLQANNPQHAPLHPNLYLQANNPQHAPLHPNLYLQGNNPQHAPLHPNLYLQANNPQHAPLHPNLYLQANNPQHAPLHPNLYLQANNPQHAPLHPNLYLQGNNPQHAPLHPNLYLQGNNPQHAPLHPQPPQMVHLQQDQPNNPPDVPNQIVNVESVYSVDSLSQGNELT